MATADPLLEKASRRSPKPRSLTGHFWQRWLLKRRRDRARQLSQVKFHLTREGVHFIGILIFIFIGAVIRDINLLILLAGSMIGLLLLQWRFGSSTLNGVHVERRLARSTTANRATEVEVRLTNPKHWLGAWLVLVEDPIQKVLPTAKRLSDKATGVVDSVKPRASADCKYHIEFHERGEFRVGPSTISTRFPLGLGRGWKTVDNQSQILVHPHQGQLTPKISELFYQDRLGHAKASTHSGPHEGEFYGLRPWATGDSRRWIHWRTTARLNELTVRQFEQRQQQQICVLLDLFRDDSEENLQHNELGISFVGTLATATVNQGRDKLSVALAGRETEVLTNVQSPVLVNNLLDQLAITTPVDEPDLLSALRGLSLPILSNPYLLVVSTRENQMSQLQRAATDSLAQRMLARLRVRWLNLSRGDLEPYFQWT